VGQLAMWNSFKTRYPNLVVRVVEDRGHDLAAEPIETAEAIGDTFEEMQLAVAA